MSATTSKPFQPYSSALNTTASGNTTNAYQFIQIPRNIRRSHTAERSFRKMDPLESSFHYEKPPKNEALREIIQSPYINGRKNENYINPSFYSSTFMNQSMELQRGRVRESLSKERSNSLANSKSIGNLKSVQNVLPVEVTEVPKQNLPPREEVNEIRPVQTDQKTLARNASVKKVEIKVEREHPIESKIEATSQQSADDYLNVCDGCYNWNMANESAEKRKKSRITDLEIEKAVLDHNRHLLKADKEREQARKEAIVSASRSNYENFSQRKSRMASRDRVDADEDLDIKPQNKRLAAESLRSLQRYQSMLDKMYEQSVKKINDRKHELNQSQHHNRKMISKNEEARNEEKEKHTHVNFNIGNEKSMLDRIHDNSNGYSNMQAYERRRASEYNSKAGGESKKYRNYSPAGPIQDPFKRDTTDLEDAGNGKSILDKMYQSSMEYWRRQKDGLKESSKANKDVGANKFNRKGSEEQEALSSYRSGQKKNGRNLLDMIYSSDEKGLAYRKNGVKECANYNKDQGYAEERELLKAKTLESYYKSPSRKVGDGVNIDYDRWTHENSGVFSKINAAVEKLEQERKVQIHNAGYSLKQQIDETVQRKKEEIYKDKTFRETPLLVCSHKANLMYCNICNRKVPMNKISKIIGDYKKMMKNRTSGSGR